MTTQLANILDAGADTAVIYGLAYGNAQTLLSMEKINYMPTAIGTWGNMSSVLVNTAGKKLSEHLVFATSTAEDSNPRATALAARVREHYPSMVTFVSAAQAYDSVMLVAAAIKQAGTTDGAKLAAALESAMPDVQGVIKLYKKPFSKANHEGLGVEDFQLGKWKDGKVTNFSDAVVKSITPADLKK